MSTIESGLSPETKEKVAEVVLHFFRHGEQFKDPQKTNQAFELSERGREQAMKKASTTGGKRNLGQTMAFGSPRVRAQQTAGFAMAAEALDTIDGSESLDDLKKKLDKDVAEGQKYGTKIMVDPRLDFFMDTKTPFGEKSYDAFIKQTYMDFIVHESDRLAEEVKDERGSTYSRQAKDVGEIVKKYLQVSGNWEKLVESGKYADYKLERFLGSHGGVTESFLLKVIEKTKGEKERERLLSLMPNGFDYTEGFDISIRKVGNGQEPVVRLTYKKVNEKEPEKSFEFDEDVPLSLIDEIIGENK